MNRERPGWHSHGKWIIFLAVAGFFLYSLLSPQHREQQGVGYYKLKESYQESMPNMVHSPPQVGRRAPDFTLPTLAGEVVSLEQFRGKVVFLNFWATWCPPCREELPSLENLYQTLRDRPFQILAIGLDKDAERVLKPFIEEHGLRFPTLVDPEGKVIALYGVEGVPETFLIGTDGVVAQHIVGARDWNEPGLRRRVQSLLDGMPLSE